MPLPRGTGESLAKGRNHPGKNWAMSGVFCQRSSKISQSATGVNGSALTEKLFGRDGGADSGRVYPEFGFQLRAVGREGFPKQKCDLESQTDRAPFRATRSKKNDANCGIRALEVLSTALRQLSMDTSPAALFPKTPVIRFIHSRNACSCGKRLLVQKTRQKKVWTMTGPILPMKQLENALGAVLFRLKFLF